MHCVNNIIYKSLKNESFEKFFDDKNELIELKVYRKKSYNQPSSLASELTFNSWIKAAS